MFGVPSLELEWFESYLTGRSQCVCVDGQLSDVLPVHRDPFWAPCYFTLYLNDLPNVLEHCDNDIYADDTALSYAPKSTNRLTKKY